MTYRFNAKKTRFNVSNICYASFLKKNSVNNSSVKDLVKYKKYPKKHFGQHFLKNKRVIYKIVQALENTYKPAASILEIGPGQGALTDYLLEKYSVTAVEIDADCVAFLNEKIAQAKILIASDDVQFLDYEDRVFQTKYSRLNIIAQDFLKYDLNACADFHNTYVVGNLPYNVGSKILEKLVYEPASCAVFMLQKEVAERVSGISYSRLGIFVQARYDVQKIIDVSSNDFAPKPKVESQVIKLTKHDRLNNVDLKKLDEYTRIIFANRRKKLTSLQKSYPVLVQKLLAHDIDLNLRAEDLKKEVYYVLAMN